LGKAHFPFLAYVPGACAFSSEWKGWLLLRGLRGIVVDAGVDRSICTLSSMAMSGRVSGKVACHQRLMESRDTYLFSSRVIVPIMRKLACFQCYVERPREASRRCRRWLLWCNHRFGRPQMANEISRRRKICGKTENLSAAIMRLHSSAHLAH
jgi:hypothetical protein